MVKMLDPEYINIYINNRIRKWKKKSVGNTCKWISSYLKKHHWWKFESSRIKMDEREREKPGNVFPKRSFESGVTESRVHFRSDPKKCKCFFSWPSISRWRRRASSSQSSTVIRRCWESHKLFHIRRRSWADRWSFLHHFITTTTTTSLLHL